MNLDQIETKCFILALFIRDDGERFLLGSRAYEFVDSQLHFAANSYQNDVVEVQGNDGLMLAGQVRRATSQAFDGYIGDQTVDRSTIEQYRRNFMKFFRKNHYYKVVYVFPDGSAVQRRNGFIVEAPEVKELYQLFPKYHISMNFEDINYYNYEEDSEGEEIYGESAALKIATAATGGLIWSNSSSATITGEGTNFTLEDTVNGNAISDVQLKGDTTQQTYSGKNLIYPTVNNTTSEGIKWTSNTALGTFTVEGTATATYSAPGGTFLFSHALAAGTYTLSTDELVSNARIGIGIKDAGGSNRTTYTMSGTNKSVTFTTTVQKEAFDIYLTGITAGATVSGTFKLQLESGSTATSYEPYVGGIPAPNPDYPQTVNTVTGRQVVTISDGDSQSQSYEVNLGKNLFDKDNPNLLTAFVNYSEGEIQSSATAKTLYIPITGGETYTVSKMLSSRFTLGTTANVPAIGEPLINKLQNNSATVLSLATSDTAKYLCVDFYRSAEDTATIEEIMNSIQIEKGSTATSYAPYFEPIELCKLSSVSTAPTTLTYQDYIYKSDSDWYIHKATTKSIFDGTEAWETHNLHNGIYSFVWRTSGAGKSSSAILANLFRPVYITTYNDDSKRAYGMIATLEIGAGGTQENVYITAPNSSVTTLQQFKDWLATNPVTAYYALATPTDTQITNTALIDQLNALAGATTYDGQTVFTVSSDNQLAILSLSTIGSGGGGVVWDQDGAEWEEGTGGGPTMISVDSIDNVYPVLTLNGPAVNPQISVLTTNTTLSYSGTVTSSQELKIDMFNKTATLNGVSVIGNVSGDWIYLKPGINRVTYTTNNADAPDATIWWQEIVG